MFVLNLPIYKGLRKFFLSLFNPFLKKCLMCHLFFHGKILPLEEFFNQSGYLRKVIGL
ncbi:hypothetical protein JN06_02467 [Bacteroides zoogleoformans]|nr:hypothetical protein JN06_02467 [Bacteroides zoogleoformans]